MSDLRRDWGGWAKPEGEERVVPHGSYLEALGDVREILEQELGLCDPVSEAAYAIARVYRRVETELL